MPRLLLAVVSGIVFGFGLALSGMMDPLRVRSFLDLFGEWDPTLAFVMGGAVLVMALAWAVQRRMASPLLDIEFRLPATRDLDARLIGGSLMFGVGWALAGLCPGPAIASFGTALVPAGIFVGAMAAGVLLHKATFGR